MDPQSCVEHSILAIFEDSPVSSEDTRQAEEENETLLSALSQMLDCVEDDVSSTLSPFDTLPDTKLLTYQQCGNRTTDEAPLADKLIPKAESPSLIWIKKGDAGKEEKSKVTRLQPVSRQQSQTLSRAQNKKGENEVEVFTSSSLVNLVKLMHPYCLKVHVEEEVGNDRHSAAELSLSSWDKLERKHEIFSQEEVWKYEKPTGDSDEEINVVSDDETPLKGPKEDVKKDSDTLRKSALLNGNSSRVLFPRAKKRVSFGPVHVASFEQSVESAFNKINLPSVASADTLNHTEALKSSADAEPTAPSSEVGHKAEEPLLKSQVKAKSLSLHEYRQLRQKRQPLAEKQGNYTTKWPSLPELPKELTPILCSHGQRQNLCGPNWSRLSTSQPQGATHKTSCHTLHPVEKTTPFSVRCCGFKSLQTVSETFSPHSPLPDKLTHTAVYGPGSKKSLLHNRTVLTTDPPNPVLLPLSVTLPPASSNPHSPVSNVESTVPTIPTSPVEPQSRQEVVSKFSEKTTPCPIVLQARSSSECRKPHDIVVPKMGQLTNPDAFTCEPTPSYHSQPVKEELAEVPCTCSPLEVPLPSLQLAITEKTTAAVSGIEASDLTSLLEQFEEKQAKEGEPHPELEHMGNTGNAVNTECEPVKLSYTRLTKTATTASDPERKLEDVVIPEPLGTEIILSTQETLTRRWKTIPSKTIQIIEPRPLLARRTNNLELSASPHTSPSVAADHDYCMPVDHLHTKASPTLLRNIHKTTRHVEETTSSVEYKQASIRKFDDAIYQSSSSTCTDVLDGCAPSCTPLTPPPSPPSRGREKRRYRRRSPMSDSSRSSSSSSSSASCSPKRQRFNHKRSGSRSWSSSPSRSVSRSPPRQHKLSSTRLRYSRSRSPSWSRSRSRSPSPFSRACRNHRRDVYRESRKLKREKEARIQKLKAIDERRVVYVGRIRRSMTHDELRERFSQFGEVECVSLHFRDKGDHYGFVTFYNMENAFAAIDNGGKLRRPDELPFDICFGGRRQFCNSNYADLDASGDADLSPAKSRFQELDFDSLLKRAQRGRR
ncbi:peroxisome proliferator-activated receptor gamma coactivator-related protein 1-like isoform X2 [Dunckerocampus dactyliophorus]|nr:peroxisome proliferator-activated receptor gamma coactivator-related protein 1-like isoform X2 [Dunckerocampus dactyliophorus]XP_054634757.1 peroxisome proliferator-activated receptor gamma coactivator-related protein 1-like isoform X2 [Dunckerocampus dactyliophorus]